jgi:hypothetical protein
MTAVKYDYCGGVLIQSIVEGVSNAGDNIQKRGNVLEFSRKSASSMGRYLRGCVADYGYMLTLTYPENCDESHRCKSHLKSFILRLTRHLHRKQMVKISNGVIIDNYPEPSFFWFLEFQGNGSPHYHIFTNHYFHYRAIARHWYKVVGTGSPDHLAAGTRTERIRLGRKGCISYAKKYAKKQEQKELPAMYKNSGIGRWWGVIGDRRVVEATTVLDYSSDQGFKNKMIIDSIKMHIDSMVSEGKLKLMPYNLCNCWITNDDETKNKLFSIISESNEVKIYGRKVLQQAKQKQEKNLYRERRG